MLLTGAKAHLTVTLLWLGGNSVGLAYIIVLSSFWSCRHTESDCKINWMDYACQLSNTCHYFVIFGAETI